MATEKRKPTAEEARAILTQLSQLSHEQKADLAARAKPLVSKRETGRQQQDRAPQTDDELHAAIIRETGFDIPRVAVCEDHCAPFDPIADGFFHRYPGILIMKSREAGGTLNASILQYMLCKYVPTHEGVTYGAIEAQANKAFEYVKRFTEERVQGSDGLVTRRIKPEIEGEPLRKRIAWKIGSLLSVIIATVAGTNSPHPNTAHADEYDLMDEDVIAQAANMASSSVAPDGSRIPALDIITSTRKSMHGPMQRLIDEIEEAEKNGYESSYRLYAYCVGEISEEVPMCRSVPEEQRRARLIELNLDPDLKCDCDKVVKSEWSEGVPRTLESVCRGRFFRSRGWMPHDDVKRKFRKNTQTVWEAELECRRPMVDGLYLPAWNRSRYLTNNWTPRPELGPVFTGTDWGGTDLSYVIWSQFLLLPVTIRKRDGTEVEIPRFSYVVFDELYDAEAGATRLADMVVAREVAWRRQVPGFSVKHRFADMAGKQQRNDWKQHNPPLRTIWPLPSRDFDPMVRCLQGLVEDQRYWVDERCSHHVDDIESWRQKNGREMHDASSHSMAASRYLHTSTELLHKRQQRATTSTGDSIMPVIVQRQPSRDGGVAIAGQSNSFADEERWRGKLGGPIPMGWR